jgi:hypothetical protein
MRRLFWLGVGAGLGSYGTRRVQQLRAQYTPRTAVRALITATPGLLANLGLRATSYVRSRANDATTPTTRNP